VIGGGIGALNLDAQQKLVIYAPGDPANGTASINDPTQVSGPGELADTFGGEDTEIVQAIRQAAGNGVSFDVIFGIMPEETGTDPDVYDWQSAFDAGTDVIAEQETGQWWVESQKESVVSDAIATVTPLRQNQFKMVRVGAPAEPNTTDANGNDIYDAGAYSDNLDDSALFVFAPLQQINEPVTGGGAVAGVLASRTLRSTLIGETLNGVGDLNQQLSVPEQETLESKGVIPISDAGAPTIESNLSTSSATDFTRSYFVRQLADRLILAARAIGQATRGRIANDNTTRLIENRLEDEIIALVDDGLLEPNGDETNFFVQASEDPNNNRKINVSFGFSPEGVVDTLEFDATINT
jgi:hypothetical protein